jgi:pyridoxal phosphate enzyme (YggS family)
VNQPTVIDPADIERLAGAREKVLGRIEAAAGRAGRDPAGVRLVAVTKTVPPERVRAGIAAGLTLVGENRVQEAAEKRPLAPGAAWHLVGPLQSNKARRAVETFDAIETVDSLELAGRLSRLALELERAPLSILLQVNVDADPAKAGFDASVLEAVLSEIVALEGIEAGGLMTVGRLVADPEAARPTFVALCRLSERLRRSERRLGPELSMGMTDDFEAAVEEGATLVRVGRALFGERATSPRAR